MERENGQPPEPDTSAPEISFEESLARLEAVVSELEKGELSLAEALEIFQDGIRHLSICVRHLDAFESQIEVLLSEYSASAPAWLEGTETGGRPK